ncbi:hypothetical protein D3C72_1435870 [compost metagenome]
MFCSCRPICSAMFMNRLLNTSSNTGSTVVPTACCTARATRRLSSRWSRSVSSASQPGSTMVVAFFSAMMAGPGITSPGRKSSRTTRAASCHAATPSVPPVYMRTVLRRGTSRAGCKAWRGSTGASPGTTASTDTASTTRHLPCMRNAKRWR